MHVRVTPTVGTTDTTTDAVVPLLSVPNASKGVGYFMGEHNVVTWQWGTDKQFLLGTKLVVVAVPSPPPPPPHPYFLMQLVQLKGTTAQGACMTLITQSTRPPEQRCRLCPSVSPLNLVGGIKQETGKDERQKRCPHCWAFHYIFYFSFISFIIESRNFPSCFL